MKNGRRYHRSSRFLGQGEKYIGLYTPGPVLGQPEMKLSVSYESVESCLPCSAWNHNVRPLCLAERRPGFSLLVLYNSERTSHKTGEEQVDLQQTVRQAFDRMVSDLRLAGFNVSPDGDPTRDDEQIEGRISTTRTRSGGPIPS
jgi:hypothetical protein